MQRKNKHQQRINLVAGAILILVAVLTGAMVFYIMQRHTQSLLSKSLQSSLYNHVELAQLEIRRGADIAVSIASRPLLIDQVQRVNRRADDLEAGDALKRGAQSFLVRGVSAVALFDESGRAVARAGSFAQQPGLAVPLNFPGRPRLLWKNGFLLQSSIAIMQAGRTVGKVVVEAPLPALSASLKDAQNLGKTGELALCAPSGIRMQCFPTALNPRVFTLPLRSSKGMPLPMTHALEGGTGIIAARDYRRQNVIAAYSPVGDLGLGMVLKVDRAELYAPVWSQLRYLLPLMAAVFVVALLLLRWQLTPLVTGLARSEQETRAANMRLRDSESRVQAVLDNVDEGIMTISESGNIELFNPGAERMFGYRSAEVIGKNVSMLMPEPYHSEHDGYLEHYLRTGEARVIGIGREVTAQRSNGEVFPIDLRVSEFYLTGRRQFIGTIRDITERKADEEKILHLANHDALTGLPNRRLLQDRIEQIIARAQRSGAKFSVMFLDLDKFKPINDSLGHNTGDTLLQTVAGRILACLREEDTVARQGGDEFIVLLSSMDSPRDALAVAQKILSALIIPYSIGIHELHISVSIGIAVYPQDGRDVETLLKNSDMAMYHAKQAGRGNYRFFESKMNSGAH